MTISSLDSRVFDANAEAMGFPMDELIDEAGRGLAEMLESRYPGRSFVFVCGSGNNGSDGIAAASKMDQSSVRILILKNPSEKTLLCRKRFCDALRCPVSMYKKGDLEGSDVIVDCALGTGLSGTVREPYRTFIEEANGSGRPVVSADVPSGLGSDVVIRPECTVTFLDVKEGMNRSECGEIVIAGIGMPDDAMRIVGPGDMLRYPVPKAESHKGQNGRLMVVAGGPYFGAPAMCSYSALRTGTDIVRVFCPESVHDAVSRISPVLMITDLPGRELTPSSVEMLLSESEGYDAVLVGPGLGTSEATAEAVRRFVSGCRTPMVIDADGLTAIVGARLEAPAVLTPHRGEFAALGGTVPEELALSMNAVVLLKGPEDMITDGARTRVNRTGSPAMTGAGTGDVLAGCVAGLLAKGMSAFDAACLGAYITGEAGRLACSEKSFGAVATDVAESIPAVLVRGLGVDRHPARLRHPCADRRLLPRHRGPAHRPGVSSEEEGVPSGLPHPRHAGRGSGGRRGRDEPAHRDRRRQGFGPRILQAGVLRDTRLLRGALRTLRHDRRRPRQP